MKKYVLIFIIFILGSSLLFSKRTLSPKQKGHRGANRVYIGLGAGFRSALAFSGEFNWLSINETVPLAVIIGFTYARQFDPGNAEDARAIWINNATGGRIEEKGHIFTVTFDMGYEFYHNSAIELIAMLGPRYLHYRANFAYLNDNEDFDVTSNLWGLGTALRLSVYLGNRSFLSITAGFDGYFLSKLSGHGKYYYTPNNVDDNPREDYTYDDADAAVRNPKFTPRIEAAIFFRLN